MSSERIASRASKYDDFLVFIFLTPWFVAKLVPTYNSDAP